MTLPMPVRNVGEALAAGLYFSTVDWTDRRLAAGLPATFRPDAAGRGEEGSSPLSVDDLMSALEAVEGLRKEQQ